MVVVEEEEEEEDGAGGAVANAFVFVFDLTTTLWKLPLLGRLEMVPPPEGRRPKRRVGEGAAVTRCCVVMAIFDDVCVSIVSCV